MSVMQYMELQLYYSFYRNTQQAFVVVYFTVQKKTKHETQISFREVLLIHRNQESSGSGSGSGSGWLCLCDPRSSSCSCRCLPVLLDSLFCPPHDASSLSGLSRPPGPDERGDVARLRQQRPQPHHLHGL